MSKHDVHAIIIAAGQCSRLQPYTANLPKCMLKFGEKTLLQHQLDAYRECGVREISVIRGYESDKINLEGLRYFENPDYRNNNILNSLFYGEAAMNGNLIVSYSDILFDVTVVKEALKAVGDISIVVDIDWQDYYIGRVDHPIEQAENVVFDSKGNVAEIGKSLTNEQNVGGEFIGMMKFSDRGAELFKEHFHRAKEKYWGRPFQRAQTFQRSYLTDLIQEMVEHGVDVHCVKIKKGWKEIDTVEDYEKAVAAAGLSV